MNKSKLFILVAVSALLVVLLCACKSDMSPADKTITKPADASAAVTATETVSEADSESKTEAETSPQVSQDENDLVIMTSPKDNADAPSDTDSAEAVTEPETLSTEAVNNTTEPQKIELPFVPAN